MTAREFLAQKTNSPICICGGLKPLGPRFDGVRELIGEKEVNDDCYFNQVSNVIETYPIKRPR